MRGRQSALAAALVILSAVAGVADTIHVPADQPTIQAGIDAASTGDTVLVASGIYTGAGNRDLDPGGRDLVIVSEEGSAATVIDCQGSDADPHRGFFVVGTGSTALTIGGFTIRNGYASEKGGGIYCESTALTLVDCVIEDCEAGTSESDWNGDGGGMYSTSCPLAVDSCAFRSCQSGCSGAAGSNGGGIAAVNCSGWFNECEFQGNRTAVQGGGLAGSNLTFTSCLFKLNHVGDGVIGSGGGLYGDASLEDVEFIWNTADQDGGGMCGSGVLTRVQFYGNSADDHGGGLELYGGGTVTDAIFYGNYAYTGGGLSGGDLVTDAIFIDNEAAQGGGAYCGGVFERVAFIGNWGGWRGGAILCEGSSEFHSCTFAGNYAGYGGTAVLYSGTPVFDRVIIADGYGSAGSVYCEGPPYPEFQCSDIFGNEGGDWLGCIADQFGINGNFSADPMFCDPDDDNFMIDVASPCAPDNNSCGVLIGAYPVGCGASPVEATSWGRLKATYR